jgi:hypothetical protein
MPNSNTKRLVDRSRIVTWARCNRERFLAYHLGGNGIATGQMRVPLATGSFIHRGLERLLSGDSVDSAVALAVGEYTAAADAALSAMSTRLDHFDYTVAEQAALTEALVRAYYYRGLPLLLEKYKVIEVESEYEWNLASGHRMMSRLDGLLERLDNGDLEVLSFKTDTGYRLDEKVPGGRIDLQGLTEPLAVVRTSYQCVDCDKISRGVPSNWGCIYCQSSFSKLPIQVTSNKMEWLIKGQWKEEERGSGLKYQDSYLVRPWARPGPVTGMDFQWQYYSPCPGTPHQVEGARSWKCKGTPGRTHGLGDSWVRTPIWKSMPIKEWIDILAERPGALEGVLYLPPSISRSAADMEAADRIISFQEEDIDRRLALVAEDPALLDSVFPKTGGWTGGCLHSFGGICQFYTLCHEAGPDALLNWDGYGFKPRTPHHQQEMEELEYGN